MDSNSCRCSILLGKSEPSGWPTLGTVQIWLKLTGKQWHVLAPQQLLKLPKLVLLEWRWRLLPTQAGGKLRLIWLREC